MGSEPRAPGKTRVTNDGYTSGHQKRRGPYLPLKLRLQLYDEVLQLRRQRLSYSQIIEKIHRSNGVRLSKTHISDWLRGHHKPLGKVNEFDAEPSKELAGVIGVVLSDGNLYRKGSYESRVWLRVKDGDYAEAFGRDLAKVLGLKKTYEPRWSRVQQRWVVEGRSILLYTFLNRPWQELKHYIEHCKRCVAAFLRAFSDGEASIRRRELTIPNTNKELLLYIQRLLQRYFDIKTTGPHRFMRAGRRFRDSQTGRIYKRTKHATAYTFVHKAYQHFITT